MPRISSAFVEIRPESLGFRNEARRAIQSALAAVNASVPIKAESKGLREEVRRAAAGAVAGVRADVPVGAESRGLRSEVSRAVAAAGAGQKIKASIALGTPEARALFLEARRAARAAETGTKIEVPVTVDHKRARDALGRFVKGAGAGQDVKVGVSVDDRHLRRLLATVTGGAAGAAGALQLLVLPPALFSGLSAATSGLVALAGAAVAAVAPLSQLAGLIPALAVGGIAVAAGFGVVAGALSGVGGALKAYSAEQKEAATAAAAGGRSSQAAARAHEAAAEAVTDATQRLAQARENQVRDAERSAEAIEDAQQSVADAQEAQVLSAERSAESIGRALDRVIEAHDRVEDSERDLVELREETAERAAEAQERYAESVARSNEDILRAEEDLADRRIELAEDVADAQRRLEEDRLEGAERIAAAEQRVRDVQRRNADRDRERRQRDQDRQRLDAARTPEERQRIQAQIDARRAREEEAEDRDRAARDLKDAQDDLAKARKDAAEREKKDREALADAQEAQAEGIEDAERRVTDARKAGLEVQKEGRRLARQQVEDERRIAEAVREVEAARKDEAEAQRELGRAHLDASRDAVRAERAVAEAVESLGRTRRDADRSAQDAQRATADAARDLERAMRRAGDVAEEAGTSGAASIDKFALAMEGLSPAARSFVLALIGVKDTLKGLRDTAAAGLLPGMEQGLRNVMPLLDSLHPSIALVSRSIGGFTEKLGALLSGPESLKGFASLGEASAEILDRIGSAVLILLPPLGQLLVAAIPLAKALADMAVNGSKVFASFVDGKAKAGELAGMFERTESTLRLLGSISTNIGGALRGIFSAALPTGLEYLGMLDRASAKMRDLIRSDAGQSGLRKFFEDSKPLVLELTGIFGDLVRGLGSIGAGLAPQMAPVIAQIRNELLPVLLSLIDSIDGEFLSSLIGATTAIVGLIGAFAQPTGALKLILDGLGDFAGLVTVLLTDLGPLSLLLRNMATALAFVGTAVAGIKIARLISDFRGLGAVRGELAGVGAAAEGAATKVKGIGLAARALGVAGIFLAIKGTIDDLAPSVDKLVRSVASAEDPLAAFNAEVHRLNNPGFWDKLKLSAKDVLSVDGALRQLRETFSLAGPQGVKFGVDTAEAFKKLALVAPDAALSIVSGMRAAGQSTSDFDKVIRDLGLGQRFMADETAKATAKIKEQQDAARDATRTELDLLDAVERLSTGLAENKAGFDENTAAGRENIRNREAVLTAVERNIEALIRDAEQNGIDAQQVGELRSRLDDLQRKYPELAGEIARFRDDFNTSLEGIRDREVILSLVSEEDFNKAKADSGDITKGFASGGEVTSYASAPRRGPTDTIPAWLAPREFVVNARATDAVGPETLAYINQTGKLPGFAKGGYVNPHAVAPGFAAGGLIDFKMLLPHIGPIIDAGHAYIDGRAAALSEEARATLQAEANARGAASPSGGGEIGGGSVGSGWREITDYLDSVGQDYTVTSTVRPGAITASGNPSNHAVGKAVDMVGDMSAIFDVLLNIGSSLSELFYDPKGRSIKNGELVDWIVGGHDDHVHAATFDRGGVLEPGWNRMRNDTGRRERLVPAPASAPAGRVGGADGGPTVIEIPVVLNGREIARVTVDDLADALERKRKKRG